MTLLVGDIGGTKTHLALFAEGKFQQEKKFSSKNYKTLSQIIAEFLAAYPATITKACFGIAGPIIEGKCQATNLPWFIETKTLMNDLGTKFVWLINDLEAGAHGLRSLTVTDYSVLNEGNPHHVGNQALLSAGTGLGEAGLFWDGGKHRPFSCEGSHADLAPSDELEMELLRYLKKKFNHVSYERVISGPGIYNLYSFLIDMGLEKHSAEVANAVINGDDPALVISEQGLKKTNKACERTLQWFASLYGAEAGNIALKFNTLGGLYIGGGIAPKILSVLQEGHFMKTFLAKGRFSSWMSSIPVRVILNTKAPLLGAVNYIRDREMETR